MLRRGRPGTRTKTRDRDESDAVDGALVRTALTLNARTGLLSMLEGSVAVSWFRLRRVVVLLVHRRLALHICTVVDHWKR